MSGESYDLHLTTLSPIHIGSGKSYSCCEFVPAKAKSKGQIVKIIKRVNLTNYYSSLSDDRKDTFLASLTNSNFELKQFDKKIKKDFVRYQCIDNSRVDFINEVQEHIKTSDKLYIPGSSIKGAIRTAIFYNLLTKKQAVKDNYFTLGDPVYSISNYTISDIKKVLKKYDLKVSGKKDELIERISKNLSDDEINNEFENSTFVLTSEAEKFLKENKYIVYYYDNSLDEFISLEKYESLFKKSKVTDSIYDVLYRYYTNLANESVNNKQWDHYKTSIGHIINISVDNISDLKLLKLHIKYFILEANNWICDDYSDYYNPSFNLEFNKSRNDLIASLKLELNELQEIFDEAWSEVKIPSYTVTKADTFKKLILAFNGGDLNEIH